MRYLITGGTGFIGRALAARLLHDGHEVTVLTRSRDRARTVLPPAVGLAEALSEIQRAQAPEAVVNLAGENLAAGRWSEARKRQFRTSRVDFTRRLVDWLRTLEEKPRVLVSGSAIGYYGARGDEPLTEDAPPGDEFQSELCRDWEAEAQKAEPLGLRVCRLRTGIVLGPDGGALARMRLPFSFGLGGPIASGRQWMSWVHRADLVELIVWLAQDAARSGAWNGTAPEPVANRDFARAVGRALHRPAVLPTPELALRLAFGELAHLLATGQKVLPARALAAGFAFRYPRLDEALREILGD